MSINVPTTTTGRKKIVGILFLAGAAFSIIWGVAAQPSVAVYLGLAAAFGIAGFVVLDLAKRDDRTATTDLKGARRDAHRARLDQQRARRDAQAADDRCDLLDEPPDSSPKSEAR